MDRRDPLALSGLGSGSQSFYMQRGIIGSVSNPHSGLQGPQALRSKTSQTAPAHVQSNVGGNTIGSTLQVEHPQSISRRTVDFGGESVMASAESMKRKRGRPRKYGPDGNVSLALSPSASSNHGLVSPLSKRGRGRPPGTGKKQQLASLGEWLSGSAGVGFTPHIISIGVGEDIAAKVVSFSQQGPRAICILSASGAVSTVTLLQPSTSGGTVAYEGRFEIVCLSGSYLLDDSTGSRGQSGGLSVSLASPDGHVIGGRVGGVLIAATPVQVILGSFKRGRSGTKNKRREALEGEIDSDQRATENSTGAALHSVSLSPSSSPIGVWPTPQPVDLRSSHIDIDLMRG